MAGLGTLISSLFNLGSNLLPIVKNTIFAPSSSSPTQLPDARAVEADLERLMRMLERIKATLHDAEQRNIGDKSVRLWLKELREVAHRAEYVLGEYMYEVYRAQVEARNTSELNPIKGEPEETGVYAVQIPEGMVDRIKEITRRFEEISNDREALCLREDEAPRRHYNERRQTPTSHLVVEKSVFGREKEKEQVIDLLFLDYHQGKALSVLPIVGKGGLGKTTIAQLVYNDKRVKERFDLLGWVCVSDDFNIERITRDIIECFTRTSSDLNNPSALLEKLVGIIKEKKIFLVLDDVWNEDRGIWELLRTALMLARTASILVTTRNNSVASIMQTMDPLRPAYLSYDKCWLLFTHYAFQGICPAEQTCLVEIGEKIVEKCGGLPLAVKSIASLLSHEVEQQSWKEILESDLWELDVRNEILAALQISYERMPTYLKPCLLLCSMFPKDYEYDRELMCKLWIAHGYIEPKGRKTEQELAVEYANELWGRSFFDDIREKEFFSHTYFLEEEKKGTFRLHDMIHDLARLNSEKTCYSVEQDEMPVISKEVLHLYLNKKSMGMPKLLTSINISVLQTLVMRITYWYGLSALSKAEHLRALDIEVKEELVMKFSFRNLKHLRYLSLPGKFSSIIVPDIFLCYNLRILILDLSGYSMELEGLGNLINLEFLKLFSKNYLWLELAQFKLPESLGFLRKLRVLEICQSQLTTLPKSIGNCVDLRRIVLEASPLRKLPKSFCKLKNLKELILKECNVLEKLPEDFGNLTSLQTLLLDNKSPYMHYLPLSCSKLIPSCTTNVHNLSTDPKSGHGAVGWLNDFNGLKGVLMINNIYWITSLTDAQHANLISKHNLETLSLDWYDQTSFYDAPYLSLDSEEKGILQIRIDDPKINIFEYGRVQNLQILEAFQPHPSLKHLYITSYFGLVFPRWMGDPLSCASLVKLCIRSCSGISSLTLGSVISLRHLHIANCCNLLLLKRESLPSQLEKLTLYKCNSLREVALLESLVELHIFYCDMLKSLSIVDQQMLEIASESSKLEVIASESQPGPTSQQNRK